MDIQEEIRYSELFVNEARKINPLIGYFIKILSEPLSNNVVIKLTNGTIIIGSMLLFEFKRKGINTPKVFIEEVANSFQSNNK